LLQHWQQQNPCRQQPRKRQWTNSDIRGRQDGRRGHFDLGAPVTATLVWDWGKKRLTGDALVNGKDEIKVETKLLFDGDKACGDTEGKPVCYLIYIDGDKFHEVPDDGDVYATSTLKK
jgi:hypothetical protein